MAVEQLEDQEEEKIDPVLSRFRRDKEKKKISIMRSAVKSDELEESKGE